MKKKEIYVVVFDDSEEAYIFKNKKMAIEQLKMDLEENSEIGTTAKLFDLTKIIPIIECKKEITEKSKSMEE